MGERWMGDQKMGDQSCQVSGGRALDDPMLRDRILDDRKKAGPFATGTGQDGLGLLDQRPVGPNRYPEMADGRSAAGLQWGGSVNRVPVLLVQSATGTAWAF
jgi:hypothetical protein